MKEAQNYVFTTQNLKDFILTSKVRNALGLGRIHLLDECARPRLPQPAVHNAPSRSLGSKSIFK